MPQSKKSPLRGDIFARVCAVTPNAARLIADGIDDARCEWDDEIPYPQPTMPDDAAIEEMIQYTRAVYAVGIAVGLQLRPEVLTKA
jgi:hypothetical protein